MINDHDVKLENNWGNSSLNLGKVLKDSFVVYFSNKFWIFTTLVLLFKIPYVLWSLFSGYYLLDIENSTVDIGWDEHVIAYLLLALPLFLAEAAVVYGTFLHISDKKISIRECVLNSLFNFIPVLAVGIIMIVSFYIGLALLIAPGIFAMVLLYVAIPVIVVEQPGIIASLKRSSELSRGSRWPLAGLFLISIFMAVVFSYGIIFLKDLTAAPIYFVTGEIINSVVAAYWLVVSAFTYVGLRQLQEGPTKKQVASIFE
ncbi:hypothetical protein [Kiloniella sp. EL199]|uniref:hypothetical protein n=1 Tax=Kiloniella sp. EL199 TaxID=2107581 RepID=UPI000EA2494D|nr:hypothetical protein [Kiloniella sp. EL199]